VPHPWRTGPLPDGRGRPHEGNMSSQSYLLEVRYKSGVTDPAGASLAGDIAHLGLGKPTGVSSAQLYRIRGDLSAKERNRISKDLLADPVTQEARESPEAAKRTAREPGRPDGVVIDVWFKTGVTDVVGDSVLKGIQDLNVRGVSEVRTGMRYLLKGIRRREVADKIALALLVNPLIHDRVVR
jgi:phosphoribosylformylglycinamidine (FGAM) synthase PurS component